MAISNSHVKLPEGRKTLFQMSNVSSDSILADDPCSWSKSRAPKTHCWAWFSHKNVVKKGGPWRSSVTQRPELVVAAAFWRLRLTPTGACCSILDAGVPLRQKVMTWRFSVGRLASGRCLGAAWRWEAASCGNSWGNNWNNYHRLS